MNYGQTILDNGLTIASLNCRGLNKKLKRNYIFQKLQKYSIATLQETYITSKVAKEWQLEWGGKLIFSTGSSHSQGLITLINKNIDIKNLEIIYKTDRILGIKLDILDKTYTIVNVYGPNKISEKQNFFNMLYAAYNSTNPTNLIFAGDFNSIMDNTLDIISGENHAEKEIRAFNNWVNYCELIDIWRKKKPKQKRFHMVKANPIYITAFGLHLL